MTTDEQLMIWNDDFCGKAVPCFPKPVTFFCHTAPKAHCEKRGPSGAFFIVIIISWPMNDNDHLISSVWMMMKIVDDTDDNHHESFLDTSRFWCQHKITVSPWATASTIMQWWAINRHTTQLKLTVASHGMTTPKMLGHDQNKAFWQMQTTRNNISRKPTHLHIQRCCSNTCGLCCGLKGTQTSERAFARKHRSIKKSWDSFLSGCMSLLTKSVQLDHSCASCNFCTSVLPICIMEERHAWQPPLKNVVARRSADCRQTSRRACASSTPRKCWSPGKPTSEFQATVSLFFKFGICHQQHWMTCAQCRQERVSWPVTDPSTCFLQRCRAPQFCNSSVAIDSIVCSLFLQTKCSMVMLASQIDLVSHPSAIFRRSAIDQRIDWCVHKAIVSNNNFAIICHQQQICAHLSNVAKLQTCMSHGCCDMTCSQLTVCPCDSCVHVFVSNTMTLIVHSFCRTSWHVAGWRIAKHKCNMIFWNTQGRQLLTDLFFSRCLNLLHICVSPHCCLQILNWTAMCSKHVFMQRKKKADNRTNFLFNLCTQSNDKLVIEEQILAHWLFCACKQTKFMQKHIIWHLWIVVPNSTEWLICSKLLGLFWV